MCDSGSRIRTPPTYAPQSEKYYKCVIHVVATRCTHSAYYIYPAERSSLNYAATECVPDSKWRTNVRINDATCSVRCFRPARLAPRFFSFLLVIRDMQWYLSFWTLFCNRATSNFLCLWRGEEDEKNYKNIIIDGDVGKKNNVFFIIMQRVIHSEGSTQVRAQMMNLICFEQQLAYTFSCHLSRTKIKEISIGWWSNTLEKLHKISLYESNFISCSAALTFYNAKLENKYDLYFPLALGKNIINWHMVDGRIVAKAPHSLPWCV